METGCKGRGGTRGAGRAAKTEPEVERARPDWDEAARLLAAGLTPAEVARFVGTTPSRVRSRLQRVKAFRDTVEEYRAAGRTNPAAAYEYLSRIVYVQLERELRAGNLRVLLWVADRLKLVRPPEADAGRGELAGLLASLSPEERAELAALSAPEA